MSVPKHMRSESPMEFMHNALKLEKEVTELLLRDFGVKDRVRNRIRDAKLDEQSADVLREIENRYCMEPYDKDCIDSIISNATVEARELERYPEWLVDHYREKVLDILDSLMRNIYAANSIYISKENMFTEYGQRRGLWNLAIGNCYQLSAKFDTIRKTFPVGANKYEPYLGRIKKEIALIKGVRSADNRVLTKLVQKATQEGKLFGGCPLSGQQCIIIPFDKEI